MRFLVTGVSGQIGAALLARMRGLGTVLAADRSLLDLARPDALAAQLDALSPDMIINPAAYTAVDRAEDERELAFTVNGESPGVMARWAAARGVPFVQLSTDYVFDGSGDRAWREEDAVAPLGVYGASKLAGERAVRSAAGAHLIVRTSWIYAAQGANFLRTMARLAQEKNELRVVSDQIGAPTSAAVVADGLATVIERNLPNLAQAFAAAKNTVHLAAGGHASWHAFASAIIEGLRQRGAGITVQQVIPIASKEYPTKAVRPLNSRLDLTRLRERFGITPLGWREALEPELDALMAAQKAEAPR